MARPSRDLTGLQGLWIAGACGAYLTATVAIALLTTGYSVVDEARAKKEQARKAEPRPPADLLRVAEVALKPIPPNPDVARTQINQLVADIRTKDEQDADGFVKGLVKERPDLQGLPFQMGGKCRMDATSSNLFGVAIGMVRDAMRAEDSTLFTQVDPAGKFLETWGVQDTAPGLAALTQIFGPEKVSRRQGLVKQLAKIDHPAATKALAKAAVFDFDSDVRVEARKALRGRAKQDYTDIVLQALSYPLPAPAHNAALLISRLDRKDLIPQLVAFLAAPDPRDPFDMETGGKTVCAVHEVVKVNHHRNCLMCHSPAPVGTMAPSGVFGVVPTPGVPFPSPDSGQPYGGSPGDAMVRADVTYLRQDFSVLASVPNAHPWPELQRFDFLVRTRVLNDQEVREFVEKKQTRPAGQLSENHQAALKALRELTGQDAGPTAAAWCQLLNLPAPQAGKN
jgi:hypothetical protein